MKKIAYIVLLIFFSSCGDSPVPDKGGKEVIRFTFHENSPKSNLIPDHILFGRRLGMEKDFFNSDEILKILSTAHSLAPVQGNRNCYQCYHKKKGDSHFSKITALIEVQKKESIEDSTKLIINYTIGFGKYGRTRYEEVTKFTTQYSLIKTGSKIFLKKGDSPKKSKLLLDFNMKIGDTSLVESIEGGKIKLKSKFWKEKKDDTIFHFTNAPYWKPEIVEGKKIQSLKKDESYISDFYLSENLGLLGFVYYTSFSGTSFCYNMGDEFRIDDSIQLMDTGDL